MQYKNLVILTSSFPFFEGEYFLDDEIIYASKNFSKVIVLCISKKTNHQVKKRDLPNNVKPIYYHLKISKLDFVKNIHSIFNKNIILEIVQLFNKNNNLSLLASLRILLNEYVEAQKIFNFMRSENIFHDKLNNSTIFYSYWNDKKALSLAFLKAQYENIKIVSRAHGWDVDIERHTPPYLPFKKFILGSIDHTYCISNNGVIKLNKISNNEYTSKITVSRLGKLNHRAINHINNNNKLIIASCSAIISLKRIHLIIDIIQKINYKNIEWYHFGDGVLKEEMINYAKINIPNVSYHFMGVMNNNKILDFYSENYIDLFINVSETEGIPVSIMEAQSAGIPVLATNVGGTAEIVNNENGFLIEKNFDVINVSLFLNEYINSDKETIINKRKNSYNNWKLNYNAEINYNGFYEYLKIF